MEPITKLTKRLQIKGAYSHYDEEGDVLYIHLGEGEAIDSVEIEDALFVDLNDKNEPIGLTIMNFRKRLGLIKKSLK
ncbi:MAG: DUF2283 domain-containing protein [archaeon]|nr:DUF2283 domain-containing protein [archaeon]